MNDVHEKLRQRADLNDWSAADDVDLEEHLERIAREVARVRATQTRREETTDGDQD